MQTQIPCCTSSRCSSRYCYPGYLLKVFAERLGSIHCGFCCSSSLLRKLYCSKILSLNLRLFGLQFPKSVLYFRFARIPYHPHFHRLLGHRCQKNHKDWKGNCYLRSEERRVGKECRSSIVTLHYTIK